MTTPAAVASGAVLAEQYRQAQVELSSRTMRDMLIAWNYLVQAPKARQPEWLRAAIQIVARDRAQSARYAVDFLRAYRYMELGPRASAVPFNPRIPEINLEQVVTSLQVTGPVDLDRQMRESVRPDEAPPTAIAPNSPLATKIGTKNARAAQRLVLNGGRETLEDTIERDDLAIGYVRMTDGAPCFFCAVLASRGPVYKQDSFDDSDPRFEGPGEHKVHDGCACTLMPIYSREGNPLLDRSKEFERQWYDLPQAERNVKGFRRMYEGRGDYRT